MEDNESDHNIDCNKSSKNDDKKCSPTVNNINSFSVSDDDDRLKVRSRQEETRAWRQVLQKSTSESDDELVFLDHSKNNNHNASSFDCDDQNKLNFTAASAGSFRSPRRRSRSQGTPPLHSPRNNTSSSPHRRPPTSPSQSPPSLKNDDSTSQIKSNHRNKKRIDQPKVLCRHNNQTSTHPSSTSFSSTKYDRHSKGDDFSPFSKNNNNYHLQSSKPLDGSPSSQSPHDDVQSSFFPRCFHSSNEPGRKSNSLSPRMIRKKISSQYYGDEENNWNQKTTQTQQQKTNYFNRPRRSRSYHSDEGESSFSPFSQQQQRQNSGIDLISQSNQFGTMDGIFLNRSRSRSYHSDEGKLSDPFYQQQYQQRKIEAVDTDYNTSNQISTMDCIVLNRSRSRSYHSDEEKLLGSFSQQKCQQRKIETVDTDYNTSNQMRRTDSTVLNRSRSRSYHSDEEKLSDPFSKQHQCQYQKEDIYFMEQNKYSNNNLILNRSRSRSYHSDEGASSHPFYYQHEQHQKENCDVGLMATSPPRPYKNIAAKHHSSTSSHNGPILLKRISFHSDEDVTLFRNSLPGPTAVNCQTKPSIVDNGSSFDHEHTVIGDNVGSIMRNMTVDDNDDDDVEVMNGSGILLPMPQPSEQTAKEQMIERERQSRKERERARLKRQIALNSNTNNDDHDDDDDDLTQNCLEHESIACTIGAEDSIMVQHGHGHNHECNEVDSEIKNSSILVADNPDDQIPLGFAMERFLSAGVVVESRHSNDGEATCPNPPSSVVEESADDANEDSSHNVTDRATTNENKNQQEVTVLSNSDSLTAANPSQNLHVVEVGNVVIGTTSNSIINSQDDDSHSIMENQQQHEVIVAEITSPTNDNFLDDFSSDNRISLSSRESDERESDDDVMENPVNGPRLARLTEAEILEMAEIDYASIGNMPPHSHVASSVSSNDTRSGFRNSHETGLSFNISEGDDTQTTVQESSNTSATTLSIVEVHSANSDEIIISDTSSSTSHHHFQLETPLSKDNNIQQSRTLDEDILSEHDRILITNAEDHESYSSLLANQSVGESTQPRLTSHYPRDLQRETSNHQPRQTQMLMTVDDFESHRFQSEVRKPSPDRTLDETTVLLNRQLTSSNDLYLDNSPRNDSVHYGTLNNSSVYDANIKSDDSYSYVSINVKGSKFDKESISVNISRGDDDNANNMKNVFHHKTFNNKSSIESVFSSIRSLSTSDIEAEMKDSDKYATKSIFSSGK